MRTHAECREYYQGVREGLWRYAWWKDGVEYVGTCGRTLVEAKGDVDLEESRELLRIDRNEHSGLQLRPDRGAQ